MLVHFESVGSGYVDLVVRGGYDVKGQVHALFVSSRTTWRALSALGPSKTVFHLTDRSATVIVFRSFVSLNLDRCQSDKGVDHDESEAPSSTGFASVLLTFTCVR